MANSDALQKRDGFKSQFGFIMAAVGSRVGMANVWRFPMLVSRYGSLTLLIPYAIFAFIVCQSGMMEEFSLDRWACSGPPGAFGKAMENGGHPKEIGEWLGGTPVVGFPRLAIGYSVAMGWVLIYTKMAITGEPTVMGTDMNVIGGAFSAMAPEADSLPKAIRMTLTTGGANNLWITISITVSFAIMLVGIFNDIEAPCRIMLPILYALFVVLATVMIFIPDTAEGYKYIFAPDPKSLLNPKVWVYAFGQRFFSLSVTGSGSVVYGSHLGKDVKIRQPVVICTILDTSYALLAMFVITLAMVTTGADLGNGGPGLMSVSMLPVFNGIGGIPRLIVIFSHVAILFAGISPIINLFETPVNFLQQQFHLKYWMAAGLIHVVDLIVALLIQPWTSQWTDIASIYILPLGAVVADIMFFWVMKKKDALAAAQLGSDELIMKRFMPFGKYVFIPLCIACFVLGIWWGGIG